jgi:hypothetical protein
MQVNRHLKDEAMDRIDHALGRPVDALSPTSREYYCTDDAGLEADEMRASPHWREGRRYGESRWFTVTPEGRIALHDHLRKIGDRHRAFDVTYRDITSQVVATSRSKARYQHWLGVSDAVEISFFNFCRRASVRLSNSSV